MNEYEQILDRVRLRAIDRLGGGLLSEVRTFGRVLVVSLAFEVVLLTNDL